MVKVQLKYCELITPANAKGTFDVDLPTFLKIGSLTLIPTDR